MIDHYSGDDTRVFKEVTEVGEKMAPLFRLLVYKAISKMTADMIEKTEPTVRPMVAQPVQQSVIIDDM